MNLKYLPLGFIFAGGLSFAPNAVASEGVGIKVNGQLNQVEYAKVEFTGECPGEGKKKPFKGRFFYPPLFDTVAKKGVEFKKVILKNIDSAQVKEKKFPDNKKIPGVSDDFKIRWDKDLKIQPGSNTILYSFKVKVDGEERIIDGGEFTVNATVKTIRVQRNSVTESRLVCDSILEGVSNCSTPLRTKVEKVCYTGGLFGRKVIDSRYENAGFINSPNANTSVNDSISVVDPGDEVDFGSLSDWTEE